MAPSPPPDAEVDVDLELAHALVASQHPELLGPVRRVAAGWDNVVFRLGPDLALRLPRRRAGAELVAKELRWVPELAPQLAVRVPVPLRAGSADPALGYPSPWSIVRWVPGAVALTDLSRWADATRSADLVGVLASLSSVPVPGDAPTNPHRGVPLSERASALEQRLDVLPPDIDRRAVERAWGRALEADGPTIARTWIHGDLHPGNLVLDGGRLAGVIDWGDLAVGDRACDLAVAWMVLSPRARVELRGALDVTDAEWERARGNALAHGVAVLAHSAGSPALASSGRATVQAVLSDRG